PQESQKIATAIVGLARALALSVTAAGLEDAWTLEFLRNIGCDVAQGYLISRPVDGDTALAWARAEGHLPPIGPSGAPGDGPAARNFSVPGKTVTVGYPVEKAVAGNNNNALSQIAHRIRLFPAVAGKPGPGKPRRLPGGVPGHGSPGGHPEPRGPGQHGGHRHQGGPVPRHRHPEHRGAARRWTGSPTHPQPQHRRAAAPC